MTSAVAEKFRKSFVMEGVTTKAKGNKWIVEGYVSTNIVDHMNDRVTLSGLESLAKTLDHQRTVLFNHDTDRPIGKILALKVQELPDGEHFGLFVKIQISKSEPLLWEKLVDGTINKFSWAGFVLEAEFVTEDGVEIWNINKVDAFEASLVSIPANNSAEVTDARVGKFLGGNVQMASKIIPQLCGAPDTEPKSKELTNEQGDDMPKKTTKTAKAKTAQEIVDDATPLEDKTELNKKKKSDLSKALAGAIAKELLGDEPDEDKPENPEPSEQPAGESAAPAEQPSAVEPAPQASGEEANPQESEVSQSLRSPAIKELVEEAKSVLAPESDQRDERIVALEYDLKQVGEVCVGLIAEVKRLKKHLPLRKGVVPEQVSENANASGYVDAKEILAANAHPMDKARALFGQALDRQRGLV